MPEAFYRRENLIDKEVYDIKAMHVGTVKDVAYAKDGQIALIVSNQEERTIPFQSIFEIGDIILVTPATDESKPAEPTPPQVTPRPPQQEKAIEAETRQTTKPGICPKCQKENKPTAKFCGKCGFRFA